MVNANDMELMDSEENYSNTPIEVLCGNMNLNDTRSDNLSYYLESNRRALLRCRPDSVINFNGVLDIKVLQGRVRIGGYVVTKKETHCIRVYSLNAYTFMPIELLQSDRTIIKKNKLSKLMRGLAVSEINIDVIMKCLEPDHCLLYVENPIESSSEEGDKVLFHMIHRLNYSIPSLLPEINYFHTADMLENHLKIRFMKSINSTLGAPVLMQPASWSTLYEQCIQANARLVLCGGSGLGKTTLLRYLINRSVQEFGKSLVIDLDPGQAEFFLPGTLSARVIDKPIFGPNFTQLKNCKLEVAFFLGEVKIHSNAHTYIRHIRDLLDDCRSREGLNHIPWFVNTMGYVKDMGARVNCRIIQETQPTHVIQIQGRKPEDNFQFDLTCNNVTKNAFDSVHVPLCSERLNFQLVPIDSVKNKPFDNMNKVLKPADRRKIMLTAYFSYLFPSQSQGEYSVNHCIPFAAKLKHLQVAVTNESGGKLSRAEILAAMNGELIALASRSQGNKAPVCLGYGIVHCIDPTSQELFLVTPHSLSDMAAVKTLILGAPSLSLPRKFLDARCKELLGQRLPYAARSSGEGQIMTRTTSRSYRKPERRIQRAL